MITPRIVSRLGVNTPPKVPNRAAAESPAVWGLSLMATPSIPDRGARVQPRRAFSGRAGF